MTRGFPRALLLSRAACPTIVDLSNRPQKKAELPDMIEGARERLDAAWPCIMSLKLRARLVFEPVLLRSSRPSCRAGSRSSG